VVTLILSFMIASNIESYRHPESIDFLREAFITSLKDQQVAVKESEKMYDQFVQDFEVNLVEVTYQKVSMIRIIGCIVALFGAVFLRTRKKIGLHLFIGGNIFMILGCFYFLGFSLSGWILNFMYLVFGLLTSLYFGRKRGQLHGE